MDNRSGEMQVFTRVVDSGSFSAAGKALGLSASAVSKLVTRIEERLGVLLFQRTTRALTLTSEGQRYYARCVHILADIEDVESGLSQDTAAPQGLLRVSASIPFGTHRLLPLVAAFRARYPGIRLDLSFTDRLADLQREAVDVAIRMGPLPDASFHARPLGRFRRAVVAAPAYLERAGTPRHPDELARHDCLTFNFRRSASAWPFRIDGQLAEQAVGGSILANNGETVRQLALDGHGIARLGLFHVADDLRQGRLVELLPGFNALDEEEINVIYSNQRYMPRRVRVFIDFLLEHMAAGPA